MLGNFYSLESCIAFVSCSDSKRLSSHVPTALQPSPARRAQKARRVSFQAGSSTPLHLIGVELEKVGDDFGFVRVVRKAVCGNGQDGGCP